MHVSTGIILERFPDNLVKKQVPSPGPCFSASLRLPHGMSGAPIFDDEGVYAHGVVSTGWNWAPMRSRWGLAQCWRPLWECLSDH
jgi:hypothetical protein